MSRRLPIVLAALLTATPLAAAPMLEDRWPLVAFARDGDCELTITGDGKFFRLMATGLPEGGGARLHVTNADMTPIDRAIRSDGGGAWRQYYLPFLWGRPGGEVQVTVEAEGCRVAAGFPWQRGIRVID